MIWGFIVEKAPRLSWSHPSHGGSGRKTFDRQEAFKAVNWEKCPTALLQIQGFGVANGYSEVKLDSYKGKGREKVP